MSEPAPVIIEAAINGAGNKARNPHIPTEPGEIIADATACFDAGAAIVHSHCRDHKLTGRGVTFGLPPTRNAPLALPECAG